MRGIMLRTAMKDVNKSDKKNITYIYRICSILCTNVLPSERDWWGDIEIDKIRLTSKSESFE